jgi:hypothetical protein
VVEYPESEVIIHAVILSFVSAVLYMFHVFHGAGVASISLHGVILWLDMSITGKKTW